MRLIIAVNKNHIIPRKAHSNGISNEQCRDPQLEKGCHKLLDGNAPNVLAGKVQS